MSRITKYFLMLAACAAAASADSFRLEGEWGKEWRLRAGEAVSIHVRLDAPGALPPNARVEAEWVGPDLPGEAFAGDRGDLRAIRTAGWSKTLHALDPDVTLVYRAPVEGAYSLRLAAVTDRVDPLPDYHHDEGRAPLATPLPAQTPDPRGSAVTVEIKSVPELHGGGVLLEAEPNDTPEQAVELPLKAGDADQELRVVGSHDELEYFQNAQSGKGPDDWYRIVYRGSKMKLLTANLQMVEPVVSGRIRVYKTGTPTAEEMAPTEPPEREDFGNANPIPYQHPAAEIIPGPEPIYTYYDGRDINERIHQQDDNFRAFVARRLHPGGVYYLRVEANQPAYELELRVIDPAPYADPRKAVQLAIDYQLAEVDAWLIHRPRNIAVHTRVRDGSSTFGENCMSCHTQSGVWGVADAFRHGYRAERAVQSQRRLINTMYESLRPTIKLEDAASNTSLAPNDLGDAPAGSRVAGRNIVMHERTFRPKALQGYQQRRTANYVLQTADPKGINAAGKGSNFGPNVVFKYAAEILERAWRDTGNPKYFLGLEEKARAILATGDDQLKVVDDLGHRIEFFHDLFPKREEYLRAVAEASDHDPLRVAEARGFYADLEEQVEKDLKRLLALQQDSGGWGFDLGVKEGEAWKRLDEEPDAAPTGVSLIALWAAGYKPDFEPVKRATEWALANQFEYGLWNKAAQTGFVTNAYVIRGLSRLYPGAAKALERSAFEPKANESPLDTLARVRALQATGRADFADLMLEAAGSADPHVRRYAYLGLGGLTVARRSEPMLDEGAREKAIRALVGGMGDPVKAVREAAFWSLRQHLLDDAGWPALFAAYEEGDDRTRQSVVQALVTRADLAGSGASVKPAQLAGLLRRAMQDPHAGVRAYVFKAAWRWWIWNPGMRDALNLAWADHLTRAEPNAHAEAALRYSTTSLLMVNGQIANQTGGDNLDQQYRELSELYDLLERRRLSSDDETVARLDRRLTAVAATHFQERGNDGGPGQMGYSTPRASEVLGDAVLAAYRREEDPEWRKIALEGATNINHGELERTLLELLRTGDLDMVATAARALANPQALSLPARPEALRQLLDKVDRFLAAGRPDDARALARFLSKVKWDFEGISPEQEKAFYELLVPSGRAAASRLSGNLLGRPAPEPETEEEAGPVERAALLGEILGGNRSLQRRSAFDFVESGSRELWLSSTEWMLAYEEGGIGAEEAVEGAVEAEDLEVAELTFGRTTAQIVPDGLTSRNTVLWWREGVPGAKLTLAFEAPQGGRFEVVTAFLYDREMGIVQFALNGEDIGEPWDFYRADLTGSGPVSLGVHELKAGRNLLTVKMLGSNPDAEANHIFGIDYLKLAPDEGSGSLFTKDERGVDVIDPIVAAKGEVVKMFTSWFSADAPREAREEAIRLANRTALRRNPDVRKALAEYVDHEPIPRLRVLIQNILNSDDEVYGKQLEKLIVEQKETVRGSDVRPLEAEKPWIDDILHFRDYAFAEMTKINESDNRACISCHGVPGRVPTLYLAPPDAAGYIPPADLLANYRRMQQRVDLADVEKSKFLLKPLNIQTGEDDGHQGGVRYERGDAGYRVIRDWVLRQAELQKGR